MSVILVFLCPAFGSNLLHYVTVSGNPDRARQKNQTKTKTKTRTEIQAELMRGYSARVQEVK